MDEATNQKRLDPLNQAAQLWTQSALVDRSSSTGQTNENRLTREDPVQAAHSAWSKGNLTLN